MNSIIDDVEREIKMCERVPRDLKATLREIVKNHKTNNMNEENDYAMMLSRKFKEN